MLSPRHQPGETQQQSKIRVMGIPCMPKAMSDWYFGDEPPGLWYCALRCVPYLVRSLRIPLGRISNGKGHIQPHFSVLFCSLVSHYAFLGHPLDSAEQDSSLPAQFCFSIFPGAFGLGHGLAILDPSVPRLAFRFKISPVLLPKLQLFLVA